MKDINKITQINIYITSKVLRNRFDQEMAEDIRTIEKMFEKNDFKELDDIYHKYFIVKNQESNQSSLKLE